MMNKLIKQFNSSVKGIAEATDGRFEGERVITVRRRVSAIEAAVSYREFKISFLYHVGRGSGPKSVMSCIFYKNGDPLSVGYLMYDLMGVIDKSDIGCYTYAYLPDADALRDAFDYLSREILRRMDDISAVFSDSERYLELREAKTKDIVSFFGRDVFMQSEQMDDDMRKRYLSRVYDVFYSAVTTRFSSGGYSLFLQGDKSGALKRYNMYHHLTAFERRLLERLRSDTPLERSQAPNYLTDGLAAQNGKGVFLPLTLSWLAFTAALTPLFFGIYMLVVFLLSDGAVYSTSAELASAVDVVLPAAVTAVGLSYRFRDSIIAFMSRKRRALHRRYAAIVGGGNDRGIIRYFVQIVLALSIIFTMLIANHGVRFYDDRLLINPTVTSLRPTEYVYSEIEAVYVVDGFYADTGEFIDEPGTVVCFSDGTVADLTGFADNRALEKEVHPVLKKNGVKIIRVKALADIEDGTTEPPHGEPKPAKT